MLRLIYFEIRKNFLRKHIIIFLLSFLTLNFIYFNITFMDNEYFFRTGIDTKRQWKGYYELHNKLDGKLTKEKINFIIEENNRLDKIISEGTYSKKYQKDSYTGYIFGDMYLINKYFYNPIKYLTYYKKNNDELVDNANKNITFYNKYNNKYEVKKNKFITRHYSGRQISDFYETVNWGQLFEYSFSDLLIILILVVSLVPIYVNEKKIKMNELILTCDKGDINYIYSKIIAVFIFVFFLISIFSIENFLLEKIYYNLSGYNMPLYSIEAYQNTPLNISILSFYLLLNSLKILGAFNFSLILMLLSLISKKVVIPFLVSCFFIVISIFSSAYFNSIYLGKAIIALINPFTLLRGEKLFIDLFSLNIFNKFYFSPVIAIVANIFFTITLILIFKRLGMNKEKRRLNFVCLRNKKNYF